MTLFDNPQSVLKTWTERVNNGASTPVAAMYSEDAVLLPTFSNKTLSTPGAIEDYFVRLARHDELSVELHEKTLAVHELSGHLHIMSGIYCFRFAVEEELLSFEARFTLAVNLGLERPIVHHHSSQVPRML